MIYLMNSKYNCVDKIWTRMKDGPNISLTECYFFEILWQLFWILTRLAPYFFFFKKKHSNSACYSRPGAFPYVPTMFFFFYLSLAFSAFFFLNLSLNFYVPKIWQFFSLPTEIPSPCPLTWHLQGYRWFYMTCWISQSNPTVDKGKKQLSWLAWS